MNKLKIKSTLNHKAASYTPYEVEVEKVIMLYGNGFNELMDRTLDNNAYIDKYKDLMCVDENNVAHCLLFIDNKSGDGLLVESEGAGYARMSQFIPNAKAVVLQNELTEPEIRLHNELKEFADKIAGYAHNGRTGFDLEELSLDVNFNEMLFNTVCEMLRQREDIKQVEAERFDYYEPNMKIEPEPLEELKFYCPLKIVTEPDEPYFDEEYYDEERGEISPESAVDYADEINSFLENFREPKEQNRGIMIYYNRDQAISEKVYSAFLSVEEVDGSLMGVVTTQIAGELTDTELEELRDFLTGQAADGIGESIEQRGIKVADNAEIYVSFWNGSSDWSMQTEKEYEIEQAEEMSQPGMSM